MHGLIRGTRQTKRNARLHRAAGFILVALTFFTGCQWFVDDADREVHRLIEDRQRDALGQVRPAPIDSERVPIATDAAMYDKTPSPVDAEVPASFEAAPAQPSPAASQPAGAPATQPVEQAVSAFALAEVLDPKSARVLSLADVLEYSFKYSREFQSAKEDLYLAALSLSLERFLWTPQWIGEVRSQYANYGQIRDFDHAMDAVAEVAVEQRLPYGGEVAARTIGSLMRDLTHHVTTGESGAMILEANIPLLRGAGRVARESLYQAERDLIYAVRTLERFRRELAVRIAGDYFNLQRLRQEVLNASESIKEFEQEVARAQAHFDTGRLIYLEVQRADQERLDAISRQVDALEAYLTALDQFKILIGMPAEEDVTVELPDEGVEGEEPKNVDLEARSLEEALQMPDVAEKEAIRVALKYRLDLLNDRDRVDDARRGVKVAENNLLPDLAAWGSVRMDTKPDELGVLKYNSERTTWRGGLSLELPLNRKAEQVQLRTALIDQRRAQRGFDEAQDLVRYQVRRAMRRVRQEHASLMIQTQNRDLALMRRTNARIQFDKARVSNREIFDAENALLNARDRLAQAQAQHRLAILEFRRDTGTLRVDDDGKWARPVATTQTAR